MTRETPVGPPAGEAVLAVLADLRYWSDRGVRAERDVGGHVERLRGAARLGDVGRELHGVAGGVRRRDELLGARGAPRVVGGALREADLERADLAAAELDLAGALLERTGPG